MIRTIKLAGILLAAVLLLAGCAGQTEKVVKLEDLEGKIVALMAVPVPAERIKASIEEAAGVTLKEVMYYDTFQAAIAALKSGKADAVFSMEPVANYYIARDDTLAPILMNKSEGANTFHMTLRAKDTELIANINAALLSMEEDGTLDALAQEFVTGLTPEKQLEGKQLPYFDDASTLYVGLSGDNPPVDYVAADGKPAGFNVELLAMLSEALHINFEISVMPLETKFPALVSNKIDIFFLHPINENEKATVQTMAENEDIALSKAYYSFDSIVLLVLK